MFGYACRETEDLMPAPIYFSHKILRLMAKDRKNGSLIGIEPDLKKPGDYDVRKWKAFKSNFCSDLNSTL